MTYRIFFSLILLIGISSALSAENQYKVSNVDGGMPYLLHLPDGYEDNPEKLYPTIIFLHGYGERCSPDSYGTTDELHDVENAGGTPPRLIRDGYPPHGEVNGETEYFIVISPQISTSSGHWNAEDVVGLLDEVSAEVRIDPDRVYLTGFSFGGTGVWHVLTESANSPNRFAAAAPGAGWSDVRYKHNIIAENRVALWSLSGLDDPTEHTPERVLLSNRELRIHLSDADHKVTLYPGVGHSASRPYHLGHTYQDPNLYDWFLQHTLQEPGLPERVNLAESSSVNVTAGDVQDTYGPNRVKSNTNTFWGSDTDNYDDKWVMLDLGSVSMVDQIYLRFASSTSSSIQPTSPYGTINSIEASPTNGRIRIFAPNHERRSGSATVPSHLIWIKDSDDYDGGPYEVKRVNSSSETNPDGWFEIEKNFTGNSSGTWYTLNQTTAAYLLETSVDGESWDEIANVADNYEFNRQHHFDAKPMRYVRLKILRANRMELPEFEHLSRIYEIKVIQNQEPLDPPTAPSDLSSSEITSAGVRLDWNAGGGVVEGYRIYWSTDGQQPSSPQATIPYTETGYEVSGLTSETAYQFWVSSYNSGGESGAVTTSATTLEITPPAPPSNIGTTGVSANGLTLFWTDEADSETEYRIYWNTADDQPSSPSQVLPADSINIYVDNLSPETDYYFWVSAANSEGESTVVSTSATTLAASGSVDVGLISHWSFDAPTGAKAFDSTGLADGTFVGDSTRLTGGLAQGAVTLDGTNDWIEIPHQSDYSTDAISFSFWIRPTEIDSQPRGILSKRSGTGSSQRAFSIFSYANGEIYLDIGPTRARSSLYLEALPDWQHLVVVFDGSSSEDNLQLYHNGNLVFTGTASTDSVPEIDCPLTLGILNPNYGNGFLGDLDEVRIYDRVLLPAEVSYLYENEPVEADSGEIPTSFNDWVQLRLSEQSSAEQDLDADPDADGLSNLLEYALQSDPASPSSSQLPTPETILEDDQPFLSLSYRRIAGGTGNSVEGYSVNNLIYTVQFSPDLGANNWEGGSENLEELAPPEDHEDGTETVTVRMINPIEEGSPAFLRLEIESVTP